MKGVSLAVTAIVVILLGAAVLLAYIYFVNQGWGQMNIIEYQSALRSCCTDRLKYNCDGITNAICKVPWGSGEEPLFDLMRDAGVHSIDELDGFCFCQNS